MHYRTIGMTGLDVSEIGFGAWGFLLSRYPATAQALEPLLLAPQTR